MGSKINLRYIASSLNLSIGTVSRVLNGKAKQYRISDATVKLVMDFAHRHGYKPNMIAKGLQASKTYTLGLIIPDISNPFFSNLAKYVEYYAGKLNYSILLANANNNFETENRQIENLVSRKVDGIIAVPVGVASPLYSEVFESGVPLVFIDRYFKDQTWPYITSDNYQGGYLCAKMFLEKGHQTLAVIEGSMGVELVKERTRGFKQAISDEDRQIDEDYITGGDFSVQCGYESTKSLLQLNPRPTAIFAMSNLIGLGVLKALKESKLNIPDDVSLIVYDDQPYSAYLNPPLTTVRQNTKRIGEMAIDYMVQMAHSKAKKLSSVHINVDIIERASVAAMKLM